MKRLIFFLFLLIAFLIFAFNSQAQESCSDGTPKDSCSQSIKPNYCNSEGKIVEDCIKCSCPSQDDICNKDGSCTLARTQGEQSTDLSLVDNPPVVSSISQMSLPFSLDLNSYAFDPEARQLTFSFQKTLSQQYTSSIAQCTLQNSIIFCQKLQPGNELIIILVSDGVKESRLEINTLSEATQSEAGINYPPKANAGEDVVAYPGQRVILDASETFDQDGDLIYQDSSFSWRYNNKIIGTGIKLIQRFDKPGSYDIELEVTDSKGFSGKDKVAVFVQNKNRCRNTTAAYFPQDTICDNSWPSHQGEIIAINSRNPSCDLIEVCSPELDPIIEDAIDCCDGSQLKEPKKSQACNFANKYSQGNQKRCQGLYLTKGVGDSAIYMQDYLEAEMCCYGVESICSKPVNYYTAKPLPKTSKQQNIQDIQCKTTQENRILGYWYSDSKIGLNNIALQDIHAAATINVLGTGTCVDYGSALVTLLRKAGYTQEEVYLAEASNHAYTLIRLPLDRKFHIVDTTGNKAPSITLGAAPPGYPYCESILNCYNDLGKQLCPELKDIVGCEGVKEGFTKQASRFTFKAQKIVKQASSLFTEEVKR